MDSSPRGKLQVFLAKCGMKGSRQKEPGQCILIYWSLCCLYVKFISLEKSPYQWRTNTCEDEKIHGSESRTKNCGDGSFRTVT